MGRDALTVKRSHRSEAAPSLSRWARRRSSRRSSLVGPNPNPNPDPDPDPNPNPNPNPHTHTHPNPNHNQVGRGPPSTATSSRRTCRAPRRASSPLARPRRTLRRWSTPASWPRASRQTWKRGGCCRGSNRGWSTSRVRLPELLYNHDHLLTKKCFFSTPGHTLFC